MASTNHQDPESSEFVNVASPQPSSPVLVQQQQQQQLNDHDNKLVASIKTSIDGIKEIATALSSRKASAKPFLEHVEELLADLKSGKDVIEDEKEDTKEEKQKEKKADEEEKKVDGEEEKIDDHDNDDDKKKQEVTATEEKTKKEEDTVLVVVIPKDPNALFCSRVADFIFDLHLEAAHCSKGVAALLSTSQTETVKVRKHCRDILSNLVTFSSTFLVQESGFQNQEQQQHQRDDKNESKTQQNKKRIINSFSHNCTYHSKKQHKTWHHHMHIITQVAHTIRNAYNARKGFLSPGTSSSTVPECSEDHIGRWLLTTSAAMLSSVFTVETIVIDNLSIVLDEKVDDEQSSSSSNFLSLEVDTRILALSQIYFEAVLDLIATEIAKHPSDSDPTASSKQQQSSAAALGNNSANISAELRGEAKGCLFQIISRAQETAPDFFYLLIRNQERTKEHSSRSRRAKMLPLLIDPFLRVVCDRTGCDDEAQLACVKIMTSVVSGLCEQQHDDSSLLNFAISNSSKFRVSLGKGLLFAIAASQPLVLSAGLDTMVHLAASCLSSFGVELGELYCNVLLRLLDNQNAPLDTRLCIATHLRRLALQRNPRTNSTVLVDFMLCLELNPRLHHQNLIQQMIAVLSKIVRLAQPQDLNDASVNHYVTAFTARPHTAANVPFALIYSSDAVDNQQGDLRGSSNEDIATLHNNNTNNTNAASKNPQQPQKLKRKDSTMSQPTNNSITSTKSNDATAAADPLLQASMAAAADTSNIILECFKTLCCIAHALSFATTTTATNPALSKNNNNNNNETNSLGIFTEEVNQIAYCNAQQQVFQRQVDVINLTPLKTISKMFSIPLSLLKLPSDLKKTAAQVAEEAALEAALGGDDNAANKNLTKEQSRALARDIASLLMSTTSITPATVSEFLGDPRPIASFVAEEVFERCYLKGADICDAIADMLGILTIPKEGQRIERLLERFATAYWKANEDFINDDTFPYKNEDACFVVTVAVVMLNTDMYNPKVTTKMSRTTFNMQLSTANADGPFPNGFTDKLYDNIRKRPLTSSQALLEPAQAPNSSPSSAISDMFFFSRNERQQLVFGVERRRIVLESLILLKRKIENWSSSTFSHNPKIKNVLGRARLELFAGSVVKIDPNQYSHLIDYEMEENGTSKVPVSVRSVAREALSVAWTQLSATINAIVSDSSQNIGITVAATSALTSLLHGAAVHELRDNAQSAMTSLLRVRSRCIPLHKHVIQEILAVAASKFSPNLGEQFWSIVVALMREVSIPEQAEHVFSSLAQLWPLMRPSLSVPLSRILAEAVTDLVAKVPASAPDTRSSNELVLALKVFVSCIDCVMQAKARINDTDQYLFVTEWPTVMDGLCKLLTKQSKSTSALSDVMQVSQTIFSKAIRLAPEVVGQYVSVVNSQTSVSTTSPATQILIKNHVASLMTSIVSDPKVLSRDSNTGFLVLHRLLVNDFLPVLLDIMVEPVQGLSGEVELKSRCAHVFSSAALNFCSASSDDDQAGEDDDNKENDKKQRQQQQQEAQQRPQQPYLLPVCAMLLCATVGATDSQTRESCLFALKRIRPIFPQELSAPLTFALTFASCTINTSDSVSATAVDVIGTLISCDQETGDKYFDWNLCLNFVCGLCCFGAKPDPATLCNDFITSIKQHLPQGESVTRMMKGMKIVTLLPHSELYCKSMSLTTLLNQLARSISKDDINNNNTETKKLLFEKCLRHLMAAAKSPHAAQQAATTFPHLFQNLQGSTNDNNNNNNNDSSNTSSAGSSLILQQQMITSVIEDVTAFTDLMLEIFLKGRPTERVPNLNLIRYKNKNSNNNNTDKNTTESGEQQRTSLLLSAIPVSATEESVVQALNRGGVCSVVSAMCSLAKTSSSFLQNSHNNIANEPTNNDNNDDNGQPEATASRGGVSLLSSAETNELAAQSRVLLGTLCACFDSLLSLFIHVPSLIGNGKDASSSSSSSTSTSASTTHAALYSVIDVLLQIGISSRDETVGKIATVIFTNCCSINNNNNSQNNSIVKVPEGLKVHVFFPAAFAVRDICLKLVEDNNTSAQQSEDNNSAQKAWKLMHSKTLFGAVTAALKYAKLNGAVAGYLEAFKEFELQ